MSAVELTAEELAAVLRCMRNTIHNLEREREVVTQRRDRNREALMAMVESELLTHRNAVRKLWSMERRKPP